MTEIFWVCAAVVIAAIFFVVGYMCGFVRGGEKSKKWYWGLVESKSREGECPLCDGTGWIPGEWPGHD